MRRLLISLVAVVMLAALIPNTALAGKPLPAPTSNAFVYLGQSGNIVSSGDYYSTPPAGWHVWNTRDGDKDYVFELDLKPTDAFDLASLKITGPGTWDTVAGDGTWAIGVTTTLHASSSTTRTAPSPRWTLRTAFGCTSTWPATATSMTAPEW